jgi:hypothetical protein
MIRFSANLDSNRMNGSSRKARRLTDRRRESVWPAGNRTVRGSRWTSFHSRPSDAGRSEAASSISPESRTSCRRSLPHSISRMSMPG